MGGDFVNIDADNIGGRPYLNVYTANFQPTDSGKTFRFKLVSLNIIGSSESIINSQLLA